EIEKRLAEEAFHYAHLIEGNNRQQLEYSQINTDAPYYSEAYYSIIEELKAGLALAPAHGVAEITIARRNGDRMEFIFRQHSDNVYNPFSLPFSSPLAEPMRLALSGQSGTLVGIDYQNKEVLAAYQLLPSINMGIVVKIDLSEVRAPFIRAHRLIACILIVHPSGWTGYT
ncbi:hypothetical protein IIB34_08065, partial [PVC group bacterium]|nr:hypothetical protein [PVC group bacterium]